MSSSLDDYTSDSPSRDHVINPERTTGTDAPPLVDEGHHASGDRLFSVTCEGVRYYMVERNSTTVELWSMERARDGRGIPTSVVCSVTAMDVPDKVRQTLKLHGYRLTQRGSITAGLF